MFVICVIVTTAIIVIIIIHSSLSHIIHLPESFQTMGEGEELEKCKQWKRYPPLPSTYPPPAICSSHGPLLPSNLVSPFSLD